MEPARPSRATAPSLPSAAELAELTPRAIAELDAGRLPYMATLLTRFAPDAAALPAITIRHPALSAYEGLAVIASGGAA